MATVATTTDTARGWIISFGARAKRLSPRTIRMASIVFVLAVWEVFGRADPIFTSYPTAIARGARELIMDGRLGLALTTTLWALVAGYFIAMAIGVPLGFAMARIKTLDIALNPYVAALYATPRIAIIPLLVLWVGVGFQLRFTIVVLSAVFPVIIIVRDGAKEVDRNYLDVAESLGASRWQTLRTVVLPGSLPYVFVALRIGAQRAIVGVIVAEMTSAVAGIGKLMLDLSRFFKTDKVMVLIFIIGLFSIFLTWSLKQAQNKSMPWQQESR